MTEQAQKLLAQWEIEHIRMVARSDREHQARRAWHRGVEKMQSKPASAVKIWKLLLKGI
jgi:hypothetical protein